MKIITEAASLDDLRCDDDEIVLEGQAKDLYAGLFAVMGKMRNSKGAFAFAERIMTCKRLVGIIHPSAARSRHPEILGREWRFINE